MFKRRITIEQLQELTEEQKQRLREWWKPEVGDYFYSVLFNEEEVVGTDAGMSEYERTDVEIREGDSPLLDIGQMIELLDGKRQWLEIFHNRNEWEVCEWDDEMLGKQTELCDALWSAIKEVL